MKFNKSFYRNSTKIEDAAHAEAKERLRYILEDRLWEIHYDDHILKEQTITGFDRFNCYNWVYHCDVYAEKRSKGYEFFVDLEVDGDSHLDSTRQKKDRMRDERLRTIGLKVIRFKKCDLVGKKSKTDDEIYQDIESRLIG